MKRNPCLTRLQTNYLFPEIQRRKQLFLEKNPRAKLISLGIGDATEPIPRSVTSALARQSHALGTQRGFLGYGPEQGMKKLREKIASQIYQNQIHADEIFISDGAKCDLGRLQMLFGPSISIAVQDPSYPVYIEGSLLQGVTEIVPMPCTPENDFFPDLKHLPKTDLIYFCSPNNPTGAVATRSQLQQLVHFAKANRSFIIFDAAYAHFIQDPLLPKSIFEIPEAKKVAIEVNSFSKLAGFTGIRLGWTVVPNELVYEDGKSVKSDWIRLITTVFNGASNIAQAGGHAALESLNDITHLAHYYLKNAQSLKNAFKTLNVDLFGGIHAPYLWIRFKNQKSWDIFEHFLSQYHIVTTPGSGFGSQGEGFIRLTAFGKRKDILEVSSRITHGSV